MRSLSLPLATGAAGSEWQATQVAKASPILATSAAPLAGLSIETVSDYRTFLDLESSWNALVGEAGIENPFLSHECIRTLWECFGDTNQLHILLVKDRGETIGIAPLMLGYERIYGVRIRRLGFIYHVASERLDFILGRRPESACRAIWEHLVRRSGIWDVLLLNQLPSHSVTPPIISRLAGEAGFLTASWRSADALYLPMRGAWEDYFKSLDAKFRSNIRNRLKRLGKVGEVSLETIGLEDDVDRALEEGLKIEAAAWKGIAGTAISSQPRVRLFYTRLARLAARRGALRLKFLTVAGRKIAFAYTIFDKNTLYLLKIGYDPAYSAYSPSKLLVFLMLREAFGQAIDRFEFLGQPDTWKMAWTRHSTPHQWLFVFSRRPSLRLLRWTKFQLVPQLRRTGPFSILRESILELSRGLNLRGR